MLVAVDCDLHRIHGWCSEHGEVCKNSPSPEPLFEHLTYHPFDQRAVLFEIASPQAYRDGKQAHYNLAKWMIFNSAIAMCIAEWCRSPKELLVSPSSKWTLGYDVKVRHKMAKADASTKDLRECQAMIWSYGHSPALWQRYPEYLTAL